MKHPLSASMVSLRKSPETALAMARNPQKLPDYFTPDEAAALVAATLSYQG